MNSYRIVRGGVVFLALAVLLGANISAAQVSATPAELVFHNLNERQLVTLTHENAALPSSKVFNWHFFVGERTYTHMIRITRTDEGLSVGPSDTAEAGTYVLVLNTEHGPTHVKVSITLSNHKTVIQERAETLGVSEQAVREQLGLSQVIEREGIDLGLAPSYYVGDLLTIEVPRIDSRRVVWKLNGETVLEGIARHKLSHQLTTPQSLEVTYEEWDGPRLAVTSKATTWVIRREGIPFETKVNALNTFRGPTGYDHYTWFIGTELCCNNRVTEQVFEAAGVYTVTCISTEPQRPGIPETREDIFEVTVR